MREDKKKLILHKLKEVLDPELNLSVVDLGLIYDIKEKKRGQIKILMTLTTIGCPLFTLIEGEIKRKLLELEFVGGVEIELTFDPPWTPDRLSEFAKSKLGYYFKYDE